MLECLDNKDDPRLNVNLEDFLKEFQNWRQDVDKIIQQNVELGETLKEERRQSKQQQEFEFTKTQEIDFLHTSVRELQQTIEHLQLVDDENQKLKSELERMTTRSKQTLQVHSEELTKFKVSLEENEAQCHHKLQELRNNFNEEMKSKEERCNQLISEKNCVVTELQNNNSSLRSSFQEEQMKQQLQHRLQVAKLEEQLIRLQKKPVMTQSNANQEIFRNKLNRVQEEHRKQLDASRQETELLKRQLTLAQQMLSRNMTSRMPSSPPQAENSEKTAPKFNRKRKLYKPVDPFLQRSEQ